MNREIKFRVWDKGKMRHFDISDTISPSLEMNVMQFTGLKDKNGKEIYEGDITEDSLGVKMVIEWSDFDARFDLYDSTDDIGYGIDKNDCKKLSIVGNIHENKDLLS